MRYQISYQVKKNRLLESSQNKRLWFHEISINPEDIVVARHSLV
jgi:hypothetical protein